MKKLTINEEILLISIWKLNGDAYGVNIRKMAMEQTGSSILFGTLYNSLDYLVKKGYVNTRKGESTSRRGGHNKVFYTLTEDGMTALQRARELHRKIWKGVPEYVFEGKKEK